jgi:hypothetical protein
MVAHSFGLAGILIMHNALEDRGDHDELVAIEGMQLSAVTFVQDYIQLHFDGPTITAITLPEVVTGGSRLNPSLPGYRDALCAQIAKVVARAFVRPGDRLQIEFVDQCLVSVSLRREDYKAAEAVIFRDDSSQQWASW